MSCAICPDQFRISNLPLQIERTDTDMHEYPTWGCTSGNVDHRVAFHWRTFDLLIKHQFHVPIDDEIRKELRTALIMTFVRGFPLVPQSWTSLKTLSQASRDFTLRLKGCDDVQGRGAAGKMVWPVDCRWPILSG